MVEATKALNAQSVTRQLRKHVLQRAEGAWLGSEEDLLALFPVSRPTLRQAIRVLEHEQLLIAKRGVKGGYYARRPDVESVVSVAALYLSARRTEVFDFLRAAEVLNIEMCRLAALSTSVVAREKLHTLLAVWRQSFANDTDCLRADIELEYAVLELAANPAIELYMRVNYRYGLSTLNMRVFRDDPARREIWRQQRVRQCEAILDGEVDMAQALAKRHYDIMGQWIGELLQDDNSGAPPVAVKQAVD